MKFLFSKRHEKALGAGTLQVSLSKKLRTSLHRVLFANSIITEWDNFNITFDSALEMLKTFYGEEQITAYQKSVDFKDLILLGYPVKVLDAIEAFHSKLPDPKVQKKCEHEINGVFEIHNSQWRMLGGNVYLIDSGYLHTEVHAKLHHLLTQHELVGVLDEFNNATSALMAGEPNEAVIYAHRSVESSMKVAIGTTEHKTFSPLVKDLIAHGVIPKYYEEFFLHFEKMVHTITKERNKPGGGHGQGAEVIQIPQNLAEFSVNLCAVMNTFILKSWLEKQPLTEENPENDIPF